MKNTNVHSFCFNDLETGSAVSLLLTAAGYEVETDLHEETVFISADGDKAELDLFGDGLPGLTAYELGCQLGQRLDRFAGEAEFAPLSNTVPDVA